MGSVEATTGGREPSGTPRRLVLVAGSGRSGTSTVVGLLRELGVHVPQPEVRADESNPRGFGEPQWAVDFHDGLLGAARVQVTDSRPSAWGLAREAGASAEVRGELAAWLRAQYDVASELVVKDPRLTWFHDLWQAAALEVGAEPVFVTMLRPPPEVVASRRRHYNAKMADAFGIAAWVNLMLGTERATRTAPRAFVRYTDLISDWRSAVLPLGERLDLAAVRTANDDRLAAADAFVDPSLRRMQPGWDDLDLPAELRDVARETWDLLDGLAGSGPDAPERQADFDGLAERYARIFAGAESVARSSIVAARWAGAAESRPVAAPRRGLRARLRRLG